MTDPYRPRRPALVEPGQWILLFGAAAEIMAVDDSPVFPNARQILLRTVAGAVTTTLVPLDFEPVVIPWAVSGDRPRSPSAGR